MNSLDFKPALKALHGCWWRTCGKDSCGNQEMDETDQSLKLKTSWT